MIAGELFQRVLHLVTTLKFRVVLIGLVMTIALTALTTVVALHAASHGMEPNLLRAQAEAAERIAANVAARIEMHQMTLADFAATLDAFALRDGPGMTARMNQVPGLKLGFDITGVSTTQGRPLATSVPIAIGGEVPDPKTHSYFRRTIDENAAQVSESIGLRINGDPALVITTPIRDADRRVIGVAWGAVRLWSDSLLGAMGGNGHSKLMAVDQRGIIVLHPDRSQIGRNIAGDPQVGPAYARWAHDGAIATRAGTSILAQGEVVALAGVPRANWLIAVVTPEADAFAALDDARSAAWKVGALAALVSALVAGVVMYWLTRPIELLRERAHRLLTDHDDVESDWPALSGEVGDLARVFLHILRERSAVEASTMQLLTRLQAVLDNASVGIAFTREKRFELTSRTFCSIMGYEQYEMIGGPTRMVHRSDEEFAEIESRALAAFAETGSFSAEVMLVRKDQEPFWAQLLGRQLEPGNPEAGTIWILEDVTEAHELREQLTWTATHDALTGLVNRREFDRRLKGLFERISESTFCALFLDLDKFKAVNDTAGHAAGDRLLCDLSHIVDQAVRHSDTVARLGGDEFAVLLPGCNEPEARRIAEDIRGMVERYRLSWEGADYSVGASVGVVEVTGIFNTVEDVLHAADAACYQAKRGGRNRVCVHRAGAHHDDAKAKTA